MNAFLTGSRVYGKPTLKSDTDLVVRVDSSTVAVLRRLSESEDTVRFGDLNLILCETDDEFAVWRVGTTSLQLSRKETGPIDKKEAKKELDKYRAVTGLLDKADSGGR